MNPLHAILATCAAVTAFVAPTLAVHPDEQCPPSEPATPKDGCGDTLFAATQVEADKQGSLLMAPIASNGALSLVSWGWQNYFLRVRSDSDGDGVCQLHQQLTGAAAAIFAEGGVAADSDGDGDLDLMMVNVTAAGNSESIAFLRNSSGTLVAAGTIGNNSATRDIAAGDLNGDGLSDFVASRQTPLGFRVFRGLPGGQTPAQQTVFTTSQTVRGTAVGDVDHDGDLDIVVSMGPTNGPGTVDVYRNNGAWSFTHLPAVSIAAPVGEIRAGDIDQDGFPEFVLRQSGDDGTPKQAWVLRWQGTQLAVVQTLNFPTGIVGFCLADINHDSRADLVAGGMAPNGGYIRSFFGNSDGTVSAPSEYLTSRPVARLAVGDMDADGWEDLAFSSSDGIDMLVYAKGRPGGTWALPSLVPIAASPGYGIAAADFNGDCLDDLAVTSANGSVLQILRNTGTGSIEQVLLAQSSQTPMEAVTWIDIDSDGKLDLVVARGSLNRIDIRFNLGNGNFGAPVAAPCSQCIGPARTADFNGDGTMDLAVLASNQQINILLTSPQGLPIVQKPVATGIYTPQAFDVADLDGDGDIDIAVRFHSGELRTYLNDGAANFTLQLHAQFDWDTFAMAAGDVNHDGLVDLVTSIHQPYMQQSVEMVAVFLSQGNGQYAPPIALLTHGAHFTVALWDFNEDGNLDIVATHDSNDNADHDCSIFLGNGDGTFLPEHRFMLDAYLGRSVLGHFNRDGQIDIASLTLHAAVQINYSQRCTNLGVLGDLDGDGLVNGCDLGILLSSWGSTERGTPADLNRDGLVDAGDLGMLLGAWT